MNIFDQLKGRKIVEANNLNGLRQGHMIAQAEFDPTGFSGEGKLDNGFILAISNDGKLRVANGDESGYFLHYSEEHMKFLDSAPLDMFTVPYSEESPAYPRAIALYEGDTFTTDNFAIGADSGVTTLEHGKYYGLDLVNGQLTISGEATDGNPIAKLSSLPAGQEAIEVFWKGGF